MEISLTSLGSSHTFRSPQPSTDAARRFWSLSDTISERALDYYRAWRQKEGEPGVPGELVACLRE